MLLIAFAATTMLCAAIATRVVIGWAHRNSLLDHPNHRSSHSLPTPRGGGFSIVVAFYAGLLVAWSTGQIDWRSLLILVCALPIALVGWLDDIRSVSIRSRMLVQVASAVAALAVLWPLPELSFGFVAVPPEAAAVLYGVGLLWLTNLYNFMDGIDVMAAGQAVVLGLLWAFFLPAQEALPAIVFAAAALGFLLYNWPPAKIFMGDVGSGFCGFVSGVLVLLFSSRTQGPALAWLIPLTLFAADATVTLITRILHGHRPGVAHRSHVYQRLARRCGRHLPVSLGYMAVTAAATGPMLAWALRNPENAPQAFGVSVLFSVVAMVLLRGGHED